MVLASLISSLYTGWSGCQSSPPLAPLNPLSHGHGCATIHLPLIACFFSPGLAWGKASGSPLPLLRYKGGGLSRPSTESRRREDCSVAAVSRRRRWPTRRRCVVSRWKGKGAGRGREGILPRHHSLRCPSISGRLSVLPFASKSGISRPREVALPDRAISDGGLRICVADLCAAGHLFAGIARRARGAV